ncbi:MAG: LamG domain-containing protein [Acidobacteriia bacterium]|nr:LamG domain-containing protein [Terriglobia bacterium]
MNRLWPLGILIGVLLLVTFIFPAAFIQSSDAVPAGLTKALTFHASFDRGTDADFGAGDRSIYTAPTYKTQGDAKPGIGNPDVGIARGQGRFGDALQFRKKNTMAVFYRAEKNVAYRERDWNGSVSFWLSLSPDEDLAPGYSDPIQITDKEYNNAAIWVDFTRDDKPRHFRLGIFGDLKVWNPGNLPPEQNPDFNSRTIVVTEPPFARGRWTHVVITFTGLNTDPGGTARLYLNGRPQGTAREIREPFTWNFSQATIRLGVNYVGLYDDLSAFNRALSDKEVEVLYQLKNGAAALHN